MGTVPDFPYDPEARRDTPLALKLKERIRREGPFSVADYMRACLHDPDHGYYRRMPAIGAAGDFVTAPEISQVFGELIGLWCGVVWQQMGSPETVHLVELGPGRGTMMRDALRAAKLLPGFLQAARVNLVECNPHLRRLQARVLQNAAPQWHDDLSTVEKGPAIVVANEFLDTCDVHQNERSSGRIFERGVGLDDVGRLVFVRRRELTEKVDPILFDHVPAGEPDDVVEMQDFGAVMPVAVRASRTSTAALLVDYGHSPPQAGGTLQAVSAHTAEHPLTSPGEADLSAQVDFSHLSTTLQTRGAAIDGPVTQAQFLGRLGIVERASRLMSANPDKAAAIEAGVARLIAPGGMGTRFKAIGVRSPSLPPLPGF
jgi:SAM-dependent MidA family methyltransferase